MSEDVRIIHGDCLEVLPTIDLSEVGAIITDPPYGIGYVHSGKGNGIARKQSIPIVGDDQPFDPTPLLRFDNVLLWGAHHFAARLPEKGRWLAWDKLAGMKKEDSFGDVDFAWHSRPGAPRIISLTWKGIACVKRGESNGRRWHPSQKPVGVMIWSLKQAGVGPGDLVIDPYAGSGSTGVACLKVGCRCILIEKDPQYIPIIEQRIAEARTPLFDVIEPIGNRIR